VLHIFGVDSCATGLHGRDKNERIGRNPKTGVEVPITPRRVLTFRPSQSLRDRVSGD